MIIELLGVLREEQNGLAIAGLIVIVTSCIFCGISYIVNSGDILFMPLIIFIFFSQILLICNCNLPVSY